MTIWEAYATNGDYGVGGYSSWLDAVGVAESLPIDWQILGVDFTGYIGFLGVDITYLPQELDYVGSDRIQVFSQQSDGRRSEVLVIDIVMIPSYCVNGGYCNGTDTDPLCGNINARIDHPEAYSCTCPPHYTGQYCDTPVQTANEQQPGECSTITYPGVEIGFNVDNSILLYPNDIVVATVIMLSCRVSPGCAQGEV